ncbi:MAG: Uma2 family endonuclease [Salinivirgaceae bacterium]|nr:Uma2 family endonuclease [Salinivirgaceae bacterium]
METNIASLDLDKTYNYAQYLTWRFQERIELIKGKIFKMLPAPARRHQQVSLELSRQIGNYLHKEM